MPTDFSKQPTPPRVETDPPNTESIPAGGTLPFGTHTDPSGADIGVGSKGNGQKPFGPLSEG